MKVNSQESFDAWMNGNMALPFKYKLKFSGIRLGQVERGMIIVVLVTSHNHPINFDLDLPKPPAERRAAYNNVKLWCNEWQAKNFPDLPKIY